MSGEIIGVLVGSLLVILASIVPAVFSYLSAKDEHKLKVELSLIEIYEIPKRDAINDYIRELGRCSAFFISDLSVGVSDIATYTAAYQRALVYVDEPVRAAMLSFHSFIANPGYFPEKNIERRYRMFQQDLDHLVDLLYKELRETKHSFEKHDDGNYIKNKIEQIKACLHR